MQRRVPDTSKLKSLIGFHTTHDTRQIVQSVIEYFSAPVKPRRTTKKAPASAGGEGLTDDLLMSAQMVQPLCFVHDRVNDA